jgi:hypothetical protein
MMTETMTKFFSLSRIHWTLVAVILILGVSVRFKDLAWHFSHTDDIGVATSILGARQVGKNPFWAVPRQWTYAPLQYLLTPLLISSEQSYRELLFWGRLPSCLFSILALIALTVFYRRDLRERPQRVLLPVFLFAFSWEHMIFAKQMSNYAVGLWAMVMMLLLLIKNLDRTRLSWRWVVFNSVALALLSATQYSIIFFVPVFFAVLFFADWRQEAEHWRGVIGRYAAGGALYAVLVFPLWYFFLRQWSTAGIPRWGMGLEGEFFYHPPSGVLSLSHWIYGIPFFVVNAVYVFQSQTAFLSEDSVWMVPVSVLLFAFFIMGMLSLLKSKQLMINPDQRRKRLYLGIFFVGMMAVWGVLVYWNQLSLSPTRHALIFLPMMVIVIGEGFSEVLLWLERIHPRLRRIGRWAPAGLTIVLFILFTVDLPLFFKDRRDPMDEKKIAAVLSSHNVDLVLPVDWTMQISRMPSVTSKFLSPIVGWSRFETLFPRLVRSYRRIAWLSHRMPLTSESWMLVQSAVNFQLRYLNDARIRVGRSTYPLIDGDVGRYRILHMEEIRNDTELEYSRRTRNGSNNLFFYVMERQ